MREQKGFLYKNSFFFLEEQVNREEIEKEDERVKNKIEKTEM